MMMRVAGIAAALALLLSAATASASTTRATTSSASPTAALLATLAALESCPQLSNLETSLIATLTGTGSNVQQEIAAIKAAAAKTPRAVRPDFLVIAGALGTAVVKLKGVDLSKASSATITKLMGSLQTPAVNRAVAHIGAWAKTNCH